MGGDHGGEQSGTTDDWPRAAVNARSLPRCRDFARPGAHSVFAAASGLRVSSAPLFRSAINLSESQSPYRRFEILRGTSHGRRVSRATHSASCGFPRPVSGRAGLLPPDFGEVARCEGQMKDSFPDFIGLGTIRGCLPGGRSLALPARSADDLAGPFPIP